MRKKAPKTRGVQKKVIDTMLKSSPSQFQAKIYLPTSKTAPTDYIWIQIKPVQYIFKYFFIFFFDHSKIFSSIEVVPGYVGKKWVKIFSHLKNRTQIYLPTYQHRVRHFFLRPPCLINVCFMVASGLGLGILILIEWMKVY